MNVENLLRVADAIEVHSVEGLGFDMSLYVTDFREIGPSPGGSCGAVACLAGWAVAVSRSFTADSLVSYSESWDSDVHREAREFLGLTEWEAYELFTPDIDGAMDATEAQGARVLRVAAETGQVRWSDVLR